MDGSRGSLLSSGTWHTFCEMVLLRVFAIENKGNSELFGAPLCHI